MAIRRFAPVKFHFGSSAKMAQYGGASQLRSQLDQLEKVFKGFAVHMEDQCGPVLEEALRPTFQKSQERTPKRTGALARSGYLEVRTNGGQTQIEMGYARGGSPSYALLVHEMPRYHKPPTTWKFLEGPINEDSAEIEQRLAEGFGYASGLGGS